MTDKKRLKHDPFEEKREVLDTLVSGTPRVGKSKTRKAGKSASQKVSESKSRRVLESDTTGVPKHKTLIQVALLLRDDQIGNLDALARSIMKDRKNGTERITKNTVIRCLVDIVLDLDFNVTDIPDEAALLRRIKHAMK